MDELEEHLGERLEDVRNGESVTIVDGSTIATIQRERSGKKRS